MASISEVSVQLKCYFCKSAGSKYTCPRCNAAYCSVTCYKDPKHVKCSEEFYKDWVRQYLKTEQGSSKTKKKMLDILKSVHQDEMGDEDEVKDSDNDGRLSLEERMKGLDLDSGSHLIWERLTEDERKGFEELLTGKDVGDLVPLWKPWWIVASEGLISDCTGASAKKLKPYSSSIPYLSDLTSRPPADCVKYNVQNVLCSYVYIARLFNGDYMEFAKDATEELLSISGVLASSQNFGGAGEALQAVVQRLLQVRSSEGAMTHDFIALLFQDVKHLISSKQNAIENVLHALSDVKEILMVARKDRSSFSKEYREKIKVVIKKVEFLMSWTVEHGKLLYECITEVDMEIISVKSEAAVTKAAADSGKLRKEGFGEKKPLIEEL